MSGPFWSLSRAIMLGFLRDRTSLFFAVVFPLMFLVLFGGLLGNQGQSKVDMIIVGPSALFDNLPAEAQAAFDETFEVTHTDDLDDAITQVKKGDADVAVQQTGDTIEAHYTRTDPVKAGITSSVLQSFVDSANVAASGKPATYTLDTTAVEDDSLDAIQYYTPGLLGWAVAMSAAFGAAATLQGWRQSKLMRRLQLAPVSTGTIVAARVVVTMAVSLGQTAIFIGLGVAAFGLKLTGAWWMSIPLVLVGTLCFMAIGLLAGAITKTQEGAVNAANFMVLPMSFLSGSFFPLDGAPTWLQVVSNLLPLKHLNDGMLDVMVRGEPWTAALVPMVILLGFAVVVTALSAKLFRWDTA